MLASLAQRFSLQHSLLLALFAPGLLLGWNSEAFAYRPFDGTDAAIADPGEKNPPRVSGSRPPDSVNKVKVLPAIAEFFDEGVSLFEHNHYDHNQGLPRGLE